MSRSRLLSLALPQVPAGRLLAGPPSGTLSQVSVGTRPARRNRPVTRLRPAPRIQPPAPERPAALKRPASREPQLPPAPPQGPAGGHAGSTPGAAQRSGQAGDTQIPVLRLAATVPPGLAAGLSDAVLGRVTAAGSAMGTVVLDLEASTDLGPDDQQELCSLRDRLWAAGTRLRLVAATRPVRQQLSGPGHGPRRERLDVHPTLRSAVLAVYAEAPGPGLVTATVLAALAVPAEPLATPLRAVPAGPAEALATAAAAGQAAPAGPRFTPHGWGEPAAVVGGLASP